MAEVPDHAEDDRDIPILDWVTRILIVIILIVVLVLIGLGSQPPLGNVFNPIPAL